MSSPFSKVVPFEDLGPNHPLCKHYHLKCKMRLLKHVYQDIQRSGEDKGQIEDTALILVPCESTQTDMFYKAWLKPLSDDPEKNEHTAEWGTEVTGFIKAPVFDHSYLLLRRPDQYVKDTPYLVVMSLGGEQAIKSMLHNESALRNFMNKFSCRTIEVEIMGQHEFHLADGARQGDLALTKQGQSF